METQQLVDARVHDRFANKRQGAMPYRERIGEPFRLNARNALQGADHANVLVDCAIDNHLRWVLLPLPLRADGVLVMTPAKRTLVCTRQAWSGLHALIACDTIERVFIAAALAAQVVLRPPAELDRGMPFRVRIMRTCSSIAPSTIIFGGSCFHFHFVPT